ncbi:hypothetical protein bsdtb5_23290 [Anaeromicropila herbilytica]|uniref:Uncharacterized protein n=1 Tax=Anaeromicropila herbilytica TaxID=2785025 RepID=A0A7R7ELN5_9FIRM|nr:hypothetical protein bsdtb5_23290 [Anaeromicropila herbilytica]
MVPPVTANTSPTTTYVNAIFVPKTLINNTNAPKSTNGEEIKNENVTPTGNPAFENPINRGIEEQLQNGVIVPSKALRILAFIP